LTAELVAPWVIEIELDDRLRVKSAAGGGGGGGAIDDEAPQLAHTKASERRTAKRTR
jgi:hypothetical protein